MVKKKNQNAVTESLLGYSKAKKKCLESKEIFWWLFNHSSVLTEWKIISIDIYNHNANCEINN